jgi:UDP-glucose 4-epimerase
MSRITADFETLMRQAPMTASTYLLEAVRSVDAQLGPGAAVKHPELVAAFMQVCAIDFGAAVIAKTVWDNADVVAEASHNG